MISARRVLLMIALLAISSPGLALARIIDLEAYRFDTALGEPAIAADLRADQKSYGYFLIQSDAPITDAWRTTLESAGVTIYGYVAECAYLVGCEVRAAQSVRALPGTAWMGAFHPAYKLSPTIGTLAFVHPERQADPNFTLLVRVFRNLDTVADQMTALGCTVIDRTDDGFSRRLLASVPPDGLDDLARLADVWWIEEQPEFLLMNNTTKWVAQSNVSGWTPLWDQGLHGEDEIATIMDSGVDYNSCWFRENGNAVPGPAHRKVIHYTTLGGGVAYDGCDLGHGSHVAGTMLGDQSYINPGNYNYNGMAYKAKVTVQDVGADDWSACTIGTIAVPSSLSSAFTNSYSLSARLHQNSWGSTSNAYDGYSVDVDNAMWNHKDYLVCFAAGNSGPNPSTVGSPGTAKNCVTVGASRQAPQQDTMAGYSSRGPTSDNRYKPTLTAPGGESPNYITSVDNHIGNPPSATCQTATDPFQGTSMATPAVSGMALNTRQYFRTGFYPQGEPTSGNEFIPSAALIKATLVASTDDMATSDIPNNNEGWGRILMDQALFFTGDTRELIAEDVAPGLGAGQSWTHAFTVEDSGEPLVITVIWTDYPGTSGSGIKLVNDLDLTVYAPGGTTYRGNVFSGGFSSAGGSYDRLNVEECVRVQSPVAGEWGVRIEAYNIPHGPQPFAIVINGAFADWPPSLFSDVERPELNITRAWVTASPNPLATHTTLSYAVPAQHVGLVQMTIVDVTGRTVRQLVGKGQRGGLYQVTWDGLDSVRRPVEDGVYFAKLVAGEAASATRVVVTR